VLIVPALFAAALVIAPGCDITDATLSWGFKESFRSYIDSDIANGEWTTANGATYETPAFSWSGGTGRYDPETGQGYIDFTGSVRFVGHEGLLDTTIENPSVLLQGGSGQVLLDVTGVTMDGDMVDTDDVPFVSLPAVEVVGGDAVRTVDADTALTADGAIAFPNYPAGEAFDPVAVSLTVGKQCAAGYTDGDPVDSGDDGNPQVIGPIAGGVALGVVALVGVFVATRRRRA